MPFTFAAIYSKFVHDFHQVQPKTISAKIFNMIVYLAVHLESSRSKISFQIRLMLPSAKVKEYDS